MKKWFALPVILLWAGLMGLCWLGPRQAVSEAERRPLAQMPSLTGESLVSGQFMKDFESFSLDQFPFRDGFRQIKAVFHRYGLGQRDNNGIYIARGSAVAQEYPLKEESLDHALERFQWIYDTYLQGNRVYGAVIPDKGYYLSRGNLSMDYEALYRRVEEKMPWATFLDLRDTLSAEDYYRTDTHWRQENLLDTAAKIAQGLGVSAPQPEDFTPQTQERPFYGVYYGQAALPMKPDALVLMESELLEGCTVYDHETGRTTPIYDREKLSGKDPYEVFLSGPKSLLTIHNPQGKPGKELIVFRDSFASSLIPLILADYETVTLVDVRYLQSTLLGHFIQFEDQDVLFLYSTLVLNNGHTIK